MDYAGDLTPLEAWKALEDAPQNTVLVDVRTRPEWGFVGIPVLASDMRPVILEEWSVYPQMSPNPDFTSRIAEQVEAMGLEKDATLLFLCRSGVRSIAAAKAMTALGYTKSYNILGGFEGDPNEKGQRGTVNGWKVDGLPWRQ